MVDFLELKVAFSPLMAFFALALCLVAYGWHETYKLRHIPSVGSDLPILCYIGVVKFILDSQQVMKEGEVKARAQGTGMFKYPGVWKWFVVITDNQLVKDIYRAPEEVLSMNEGIDEPLQSTYSIGTKLGTNHHDNDLVRVILTKAIPRLVPHLYDEAAAAISDTVAPVRKGEHGNVAVWEALSMLETTFKIVTRVTNRIWVGAPLCRNAEFIDIATRFALQGLKASVKFSWLPAFLRPIVGYFDNHVEGLLNEAIPYLQPEIELRRSSLDGKSGVKHYDDFMTWLMSGCQARGEKRTDRELALRMLHINFASNHSTSYTFTHVMFFLASNQEWIQMIRDEVQEVTGRLGWTKAALDELDVLDSFVKETQRLRPLEQTVSRRLALTDWTLSNGFVIPAGTNISASHPAAHLDASWFDDPYTFDPLRFVKLRAQEVELTKVGTANQTDDDSTVLSENLKTSPSSPTNVNTTTGRPLRVVSTGPTGSLNFGHGKRACPGRFFAVTIIKLMIGVLVRDYDFKLGGEGEEEEGGESRGNGLGRRPDDFWFDVACVPNRTARVLFKRRERGEVVGEDASGDGGR